MATDTSVVTPIASSLSTVDDIGIVSVDTDIYQVNVTPYIVWPPSPLVLRIKRIRVRQSVSYESIGSYWQGKYWQ